MSRSIPTSLIRGVRLSAVVASAAMVLAGMGARGQETLLSVKPDGRPTTETWQQMVDRDQQRLADIAAGLVPTPALRRIHEPKRPMVDRVPPADDPGLLPAAFRGDASRSGGRPITPLAPQTPAFGFAAVSLIDTIGLGTSAVPPDTSGAIGPNHFLEIVNGAVAIYTRGGTRLSMINDATFFTVVSGGVTYPRSACFDPRVLYDRRSGRFFACELEFGSPAETNNHVILAISRTSDPTGTWDKYVVPVGKASSGGATFFTDYDTMGTDDNGVYFGCTIFPSTGGAWGRLIATRKATLLAASPAMDTVYMLDSVTDMYSSPQPAHNQDAIASTDRAWFVSSSVTVYGNVNARSLTWPASGPPSFSSVTEVATPAYGTSMSDAPALGSTTRLDTGDDRLHGTVIRNRTLWTSRNIPVNSAGGASASDRIGSEWLALNVSATTPTLAQSGRIYDTAASSPIYYYYPTIMPSGQGHAAIGFSDSNGSRYVAAATAGRLSSDGAGVTQSVTAVQDGLNSYNLVAGGANRWGDYSYTSLDPNDDMSIWTVQEYALATADRWGTYVAKLVAPAPALNNPAGSGYRGTADVSLVLTGSKFYDPGAGYSNRLAVALTGGTTNGISNYRVTYNDPTKVTVVFDIAADATLGARNVVLTNPDGQSVTVTNGFTVTGKSATTLAVSAAQGTRGQVVTLSAKLTRTSDSAMMGSRLVSFTVDGVAVTGSPATTNSSGVASLSYTIPADAAFGAHTIGAAYAGDATFEASTGSANLTVLYPSGLAVTSLSGVQGSTVSLQATLTRTTDGGLLGSRSVSFTVDGVAVTGSPVTTNASGVATLSYSIPADASVGSHSIGAAFAGDAGNAATTGTGTLTVTAPITTALAVTNVSGPTGSAVTLKATLTRTDTGAALASKSVAFTVDGVAVSGSPVTTNSSGVATLSYAIPAGSATGAKTIGASFAGDPTYGSTSGSGTLTATPGLSKLFVAAVGPKAQGAYIRIYSYLQRSSDSGNLVGRTVSYKFNGVAAGSGVTDVNGLSEVQYIIPASTPTGTVAVQADFAGDSLYAASTKSSTTTVNAGTATSMSGLPATAGGIGLRVRFYIYLFQTLPVSPKVMVSAKTVDFYVDGTKVGSSVTDTNGYAQYSWQIPTGTTVGSHTVLAKFVGDTSYGAASRTGTLTTSALFGTNVSMGSKQGVRGLPVKLYGYLWKSLDGTMLSGRTLTFQVDGATVGTGTTDTNGLATFNYTVPTGAALGTHAVKALFAGDATYDAGTGTTTLTVAAKDTILWSMPNFTGAKGSKVTLYAYLKSVTTGAFVAGKTVTFKVDGTLVGTAVTTASGYAAVAYTVPTGAASGSHTVLAEFAGDTAYNAGSKSVTLTVP